MPSITFANPAWLWLILLAIPVAISALAWFSTTMSRARVASAIVLRCAVLALMAAMLAGASAVQRSDRVASIVVVDVSDSVREFGSEPGLMADSSILERARRFIDTAAVDPERRPDDLLGVVVFDGISIATRLPAPPPLTGGASAELEAEVDFRFVEGSNIEQALRYAAALFPPGAARRIVLISDGNQTDGDALATAREISSAEIGPLPIDVIPITYRVQGEVMIEAVDAPPQASTESTVDVRVVLRATEATDGRLELLYEGQPVDLNGPLPGTGRTVTLEQGRNAFRFPVRLTDATIHRFRPVFVPRDPQTDRVRANNSADAYTITPGKGSVLVLDGVGGAAPTSEGRLLAGALADSGIEVRTIAPAELPADLLALQAYDLIILQNVPAEDLPRPVHDLLGDYVQQLGGGLVMVGGPDSLGAGGWNGTALEEILPVELDLPEQLLVPSASIAIVLDNSGSMGQTVLGGSRTKQEIANTAAALAIETLDARDLVTVIAFNSNYDIVVPMKRNTAADLTAQRVRRIATGGGTNMYPAIERAFQSLSTGEAARAHVRHVILLSDGQSQGSPEFGISLAARMRSSGISVSTIAVGSDADTETLGKIAGAGGGRFYEVIDPNVLPRIFIRDIRIVRKPLIRETSFAPERTGSASPILRGMPERLPNLEGLVLTQPRDDPKVNLAMRTPEGEPLLAHWFVGRGQVAVFTSDAHYWARRWLDWRGYRRFWSQLARTIARPPTQRTSELSTTIEGDDLIVRLEAADEEGTPLDLLSVPGSVFTPDHRRLDLRLEQVGPGSYQARVAAPVRGNYVVALFPRQGEAALPSIVGAASRASGVEYRQLRSNVALLRRIAEASGGTIHDLDAPTEAHLFARDGLEPVRAASPLWPVLLIWTIILLLLDVATRRIAWDRLLTRELVMEIREQAAARVEARAARAAVTAAALRRQVDKPEDLQSRSVPRAPKAPRVPRARRSSAKSTDGDRLASERRRQMLDRLGKRSGGSPAPDVPPVEEPDPNAGTRVRRTRAPSSKRSDPPPPERRSDEPEDDRSTTSGLLDAKRRARERLERREDEECST